MEINVAKLAQNTKCLLAMYTCDIYAILFYGILLKPHYTSRPDGRSRRPDPTGRFVFLRGLWHKVVSLTQKYSNCSIILWLRRLRQAM